MKHAKRHPLIFGTIILTATGLITRVIGFFYRIYLSRLCLLYTSPSPRDAHESRMPSSA